MNLRIFLAVLLLHRFRTYRAKTCFCTRVRFKFNVLGLPLAISFDKKGDNFVHTGKGGRKKFLFKSNTKGWQISNAVGEESDPSIYSNCNHNCPHHAKWTAWTSRIANGSPQPFKLLEATCEGRIFSITIISHVDLSYYNN